MKTRASLCPFFFFFHHLFRGNICVGDALDRDQILRNARWNIHTAKRIVHCWGHACIKSSSVEPVICALSPWCVLFLKILWNETNYAAITKPRSYLSSTAVCYDCSYIAGIILTWKKYRNVDNQSPCWLSCRGKRSTIATMHIIKAEYWGIWQ